MKKKLILSLLMAVTIGAKSQLNFNVAGGGSTSKSPVVETSFGYQLKGFIINGGFVSHVSKKVDNGGTMFFARMGYGVNMGEFYRVEGLAGYGNIFKSSDKPELNNNGAIYSLYLVRDMAYTERGAMFAGVNHFGNNTTFTIGIRFKFIGAEKYGCY